MPDKTGNKVHLMFLSFLTNLRRTRRYSWGSACLAMLYREMCRATDPRAKTMGGCASLLQTWAWHRMSFIAPISSVTPTFPLVCNWSGGRVLNFRNVPHNDLMGYRSMIDHIQPSQFIWVPYRQLQQEIPIEAFRDSAVWTSCTPIICFAIVEWHQPDRVKLQFGLYQEVPSEPMNLSELHKIDMRGRHDENWVQRHAQWIDYWNNRRDHTIMGHPMPGPLMHTSEYMEWYRANSVLYLSVPPLLQDPRASQQTPSTFERGASSTSSSHQPHQHASPPQYHTPTSDDMMSNLFGVDFSTPESAAAYMRSLYQPQDHNQPGTSSTHMEIQQPPAEEDPPQPQQPQRRNPGRNRRRPRCGTGHHYGD